MRVLLVSRIQDVVQRLEDFNQKCLDRYDVPELISMIRAMSEQGCSADAVLDAEVEHDLVRMRRIAVADAAAPPPPPPPSHSKQLLRKHNACAPYIPRA
eukprot:SAG31_NODE_11176_length_1058_cov_0.984359_1_plen_99_part_00